MLKGFRRKSGKRETLYKLFHILPQYIIFFKIVESTREIIDIE